MKNINKKIDNFILVMNTCCPQEYFHYRFQDFCFQVMSGKGGDIISPYLIENKYLNISSKVKKFIPSNKEAEMEERSNFFTFGIFCFEAYVKYCLNVAMATTRGMVRFCKYVENEYLVEDLVDGIQELSMYFDREENREIEKENIKKTTDTFCFFDEIDEIKIPHDEESDGAEEKQQENSGVTQEAFALYLNAILLCCAHLCNFLDTTRLFGESV